MRRSYCYSIVDVQCTTYTIIQYTTYTVRRTLYDTRRTVYVEHNWHDARCAMCVRCMLHAYVVRICGTPVNLYIYIYNETCNVQELGINNHIKK